MNESSTSRASSPGEELISAEIYEGKLRQLTKELSDKEFELMVLREGQNQLQDGDSDYSSIIDRVLSQERRVNEEKNSKVLSILQEKDDFIAHYQDELASCTEEKISLEEELAIEKEHKERIALKFDQMVSGFQREQAVRMEREAELLREVQKANEMRAELVQKQESDGQLFEQMKLEKQEISREVEKLLGIVDDCGKGLNQSELENARCQKEISELRILLDSKDRERKALDDLSNQMKIEIEDLKKKHLSAANQNANIQGNLDVKADELNSQKELNVVLQAKVTKCNEELKVWRDEASESSKNVSEKQVVIEEQQKQLEAYESLQMELRLQELKLQPHNELEMEQYAITIENNMKTIASLKKQVFSLESRVSFAEEELDKAIRERDNVKEQLKNDVSQFEAVICEIEEDVLNKDNEIELKNSEISVLKQRVEEMKKLPDITTFLDNAGNIRLDNGENGQEISRTKAQKALIEEELAQYKAEILSIERRLTESHNIALEALRKELDSTMGEKISLSGEKELLKRENGALQARLEAYSDPSVSKLCRKCQGNDEALRELKTHLERENSKFCALQIEAEELKMQNSMLLMSMKGNSQCLIAEDRSSVPENGLPSIECPHFFALCETLNRERELKCKVVEINSEIGTSKPLSEYTKETSSQQRIEKECVSLKQSLAHSEQIRKSAELSVVAKDTHIDALSRIIDNLREEKEFAQKSKAEALAEIENLQSLRNMKSKEESEDLNANIFELKKRLRYVDGLKESSSNPELARLFTPINDLCKSVKDGVDFQGSKIATEELLERVNSVLSWYMLSLTKSYSDLNVCQDEILSLRSRLKFVENRHFKAESEKRVLQRENDMVKEEYSNVKCSLRTIEETYFKRSMDEILSLKSENEICRNVIAEQSRQIIDAQNDILRMKTDCFGPLVKETEIAVKALNTAIIELSKHNPTLAGLSGEASVENTGFQENMENLIKSNLDRIILADSDRDEKAKAILDVSLYQALYEEQSKSKTEMIKIFLFLKKDVILVENAMGVLSDALKENDAGVSHVHHQQILEQIAVLRHRLAEYTDQCKRSESACAFYKSRVKAISAEMSSLKISIEEDKANFISLANARHQEAVSALNEKKADEQKKLEKRIEILAGDLFQAKQRNDKKLLMEEIERLRDAFGAEKSSFDNILKKQKSDYESELNALKLQCSAKETMIQKLVNEQNGLKAVATLAEDCAESSLLIEEITSLKSKICSLESDIQTLRKESLRSAFVPDSYKAEILTLTNSIEQLSRQISFKNTSTEGQSGDERRPADMHDFLLNESLNGTFDSEKKSKSAYSNESIESKLHAIECALREMENERCLLLEKFSTALKEKIYSFEAIQKLREKNISLKSKFSEQVKSLETIIQEEREHALAVSRAYEKCEKELLTQNQALKDKVTGLESKLNTSVQSVGLQAKLSPSQTHKQDMDKANLESLVRDKDLKIRELQQQLSTFIEQTKSHSEDLYSKLRSNFAAQAEMMALNDLDAAAPKFSVDLPENEDQREASFDIISKLHSTAALDATEGLDVISSVDLLREQKEEAETELEFAKEELKERKELFEKECKFHKIANDKLQDTQRKLAEVSERNTKLKQEVESRPTAKDVQRQISTLKETICSITDDNARKATLIKTLKGDAIEQSKRAKSLSEEVSKNKQAVSRIENLLTVKERYAQDLKIKMASLEKEQGPLVKKLEELQSLLTEKDSKLKQLRKELGSKEEYLKTLKAKVKSISSTSNEKQGYEQEISALKVAAKNSKADLERRCNLITQLKSKLVGAEKEVEEVKSADSAKREQVNKLIKENKSLDKTICTLQVECEQTAMQVENYRNALTRGLEYLCVAKASISFRERNKENSVSEDLLRSARVISQDVMNISNDDFEVVMGSLRGEAGSTIKTDKSEYIRAMKSIMANDSKDFSNELIDLYSTILT
eukprot:Nk52_evm30s2496 gene=Nk52_evmTU30s2496